MEDGSTPATIAELPLNWFYGPGVKLDFRDLPDGHVVTAAEVEAELDRIEHDLQPGDVVLVNTAAAAKYGGGGGGEMHAYTR
jgi:kynurenine formamidase